MFSKGVITIIAATAILATAPLLLGLQIANAANTSVVTGSGNSGIVQCPSTAVGVPVTDWRLEGFKQKGTISGDWSIGAVTGIKGGSFQSGSIGKNHFSLSGIEGFDGVCHLPTPTTITFTGQCGAGVTVTFKASNGESGTLIGNVACS
jgi:hypothetical protein